jgi:hypothetical protein
MSAQCRATEIEDRLRDTACRLVAPFFKRERPVPKPRTYSGAGLELLWDEGFVPASKLLVAEGIPKKKVVAELTKVKKLLDIVEPSDLISLPPSLHQKLDSEFQAELPNEPPVGLQLLGERHIEWIHEFRVTMWSNEGRHAGRPHVRVQLRDTAINVSLDPEPVNLTPKGGLVGEAAALKVIKNNRHPLLEEWHKSRPDTQKLQKARNKKLVFAKGKKQRHHR